MREFSVQSGNHQSCSHWSSFSRNKGLESEAISPFYPCLTRWPHERWLEFSVAGTASWQGGGVHWARMQQWIPSADTHLVVAQHFGEISQRHSSASLLLKFLLQPLRKHLWLVGVLGQFSMEFTLILLNMIIHNETFKKCLKMCAGRCLMNYLKKCVIKWKIRLKIVLQGARALGDQTRLWFEHWYGKSTNSHAWLFCFMGA